MFLNQSELHGRQHRPFGVQTTGEVQWGSYKVSTTAPWAVNDSDEIDRVLGVLSDIQMDFNSNSRRSVSLADLIVLAGVVAIEEAASQGGFDIEVPLSQVELTHPKIKQTRVPSVLEPSADGFKNYFGDDNQRSPVEMLVEKAVLLNLTAPEMAVLVAE